MNQVQDLILEILREGMFYPWVELPLLYRWLIAILVIEVPLVYIYYTVRYKRLAREAQLIPHIASISVKGPIAQELGVHGAAQVLRAHLSSVVETFRKAQKSDGTLHGEVIALVSASLNLRQSEHPLEHFHNWCRP